MFDRETTEFLESGCGLIVGTVAADGDPLVSRAWGLTVIDADSGRFRLLLDARDAIAIENIRTTARIAITGTDVRTLRSLQVKGRATGLEPANAADRTLVEEFCDDFFAAVIETDGTDRSLLERIVPLEFAACEVTADEFFDQTPGPAAGNAMAREDL